MNLMAKKPLPILRLAVAISLMSSCTNNAPSSPGVSDAQTSSSTTTEATAPTNLIAQAGPFSDIQGITGEKEISQLAQLGVFDGISGKFNPQQPITRTEFIRWLVRANNAIYANDIGKQVRLAESGAATFPDVPATHPDFRYIQGMINSGFVVGYDEKVFRPDQPLTREEMIAIKAGLDWGGVSQDAKKRDGFNALVPQWSDRDQISKRFYPAFNTEFDFYSGHSVKNVERSFGAIKTLRPQQPVTRAEAALCMSVIGDHTEYARPRSVQEAISGAK